MLGYGSFLASSNTAKAAITKAYFKEQLIIDEMKFSISYKAFDVIGEHSHKTNKISFKEV